MQFGWLRDTHGLRAPTRAQDLSETRNGELDKLMGWFGMERKWEEVQLRLLLGDDEVLEGRGERREELELESCLRREKERLLMVRVE